MGRERAVRVESQEPILLLIVGHDVDERCCPFDAVDVFQLLEVDLHRLAVGGVHRQEVDALGVLHLRRRLVGIEIVGHGCFSLLLIFLVSLSSKSNAFKKGYFWVLTKSTAFLRVKTSLLEGGRIKYSRPPGEVVVQALMMM